MVPAAPVRLNILEFQILDKDADWTQPYPHTYATTARVGIGFKVDGSTSFTSLLAVERGITIDTAGRFFSVDVTDDTGNRLQYPPRRGPRHLPPVRLHEQLHPVRGQHRQCE